MAAKFWVGGTGSLDGATTTHISNSSGGAGGATYPGSGDTLTFDTLSNATAYTVTVSGSATSCSDLTIGNPASGVITFAGSVALNVFGNMSFPSGGTWTYTGTITYSAIASGKTITTNAVSILGPITFNGVSGGWTLQDNFNAGTQTITLTNGALNTNGKTITAGIFSSTNGNTRSLTLGASAINVSANGTAWNLNNSTGMTFTANTSTITLTGNGPTFNGGGLTYHNVSITAGNNTATAITGGNTFDTFTFTGFAGKTGSITFDTNFTCNTSFTVNGNSTINRVLVSSSLSFAGIPITITAAAVTLVNVDFADITAAGAATWSGTSLGNCQGNTGITFATPQTNFWFKDTGNYSTLGNWFLATNGSGGAGRIPLPKDTARFDSNSFSAGSKIVTFDMPRVGTFDWTGATNTPNITTSIAGGALCFGNLTFISAMTSTNTTGYTLSGRGSQTLTTNGLNLGGTLSLAPLTGTYTLGSDFGASGGTTGFIPGSGTFTTNNFNLFTGQAIANGGTLNLGSSTWEITGNQGWALSLATLNAGTSTIKIVDTTNNVMTFTGGGATYYNLWFARAASTGNLTFTGSNTFNNIRNTGTVANTILFTGATTTTTNAPLSMTGSAGNVLTLKSVTNGTAWNLVCTSGIISTDFISLRDSHTSGGARFFAGMNSTNVSGNQGWFFSAPTETIQGISNAQGISTIKF